MNNSKLPQDFFTQKSAWESKGAFHLQELTSQTIPITFNQNYKSSQISQILTSMHEGSGIEQKHVAKCNLGEVKHETMLAGNLHHLSYVGWSWALEGL